MSPILPLDGESWLQRKLILGNSTCEKRRDCVQQSEAIIITWPNELLHLVANSKPSWWCKLEENVSSLRRSTICKGCKKVRQAFASQLTPHPHPEPTAWGLSTTRKELPISSVAKSTVEPRNSWRDTASTMTRA